MFVQFIALTVFQSCEHTDSTWIDFSTSRMEWFMINGYYPYSIFEMRNFPLYPFSVVKAFSLKFDIFYLHIYFALTLYTPSMTSPHNTLDNSVYHQSFSNLRSLQYQYSCRRIVQSKYLYLQILLRIYRKQSDTL
nr:MAG TPA: hypothetical protein [Caudoviricetes sp.]